MHNFCSRTPKNNNTQKVEGMPSELENFLMDMKRLYKQGVLASKNPDRFQRRLAIHYIHFVVEQILREKARDYRFQGRLLEHGFEKIIKKLNQNMTMPDYERLVTLNEMRNAAQHRNTVASKEDVDFQVKIVESFLRWSYKNYFQCDYDSLNFESFITDDKIRENMLEAYKFIEAKNLKSASEKMNVALALFKTKLFTFFADYRLRGTAINGIPLTDILADLTLKIFLSNDPLTLTKLSRTRTLYMEPNQEGQPVAAYNVTFTTFLNEEAAKEEYNSILNIILAYQDRFAF
jgi:hypothetical protein